jgi:hypothetical protein
MWRHTLKKSDVEFFNTISLQRPFEPVGINGRKGRKPEIPTPKLPSPNRGVTQQITSHPSNSTTTPYICRVPRHRGYPLHPQNSCPALAPFLARRFTIGAPHTGQAVSDAECTGFGCIVPGALENDRRAADFPNSPLAFDRCWRYAETPAPSRQQTGRMYCR